MDDTAQSPAQISNTQGHQVPAQQSVVPQPVSIPVGGKEEAATIIAEVQPTHPEIVVPEVVKEAGVEAVPSEEPQLTQEHKDVGIEVVKEAAPLPQGPSKVQLPDDYKAPKGFFSLFHQHVKKAATWLYLLLFKAEEQARAEQMAQDKKEFKNDN